MEQFTPMMRQYLETKEQNKDAILFFRLGDFYEMFFEDAVTASQELELTLTGKSCGTEERAPMCGVPFHAADSYIARLVAKGYKVAICEQAEDPKNAKGLVKRAVVRIITPGTVLDENLLATRSENYLCAVYKEGDIGGIAFCDVSTGNLQATWFDDDVNGDKLLEEIARFAPAEIIYNLAVHQVPALRSAFEQLTAPAVLYNDLYFDKQFTKEAVLEQFGAQCDKLNTPVICATGALLSYLSKTQQLKPLHITDIHVYQSAQFMEVDATAARNLELCETMRDGAKRGSLLWVLDDCKTTMGSRTIKSWLQRPLLNCAAIASRQAAVAQLYDDIARRDALRDAMLAITDIERATGRIVLGTANGRDMVKLKTSFASLPALKQTLSAFSAPLLSEQTRDIDILDDLYDLIERAIQDEPPLSLRDGNIVKQGFSEELDALRTARDDGSSVIAAIEAEERERTDIKNLKVRFNKVFGYYIEVSKSNLDKVPQDYIRKQTIANGERYITEKLKEVESTILGASEKILALEYAIFQDVRSRIAEQSARIQKTARAVGITDALCSLAAVAARNRYCCPSVDMSDRIEIHDGRHPVVERVLKDALFAPNDATLDTDANRLAIITGPNMAGKSTYMRQIALITVMAQMGSFVPASSCHIGVVDKVFTRIGASDDLSMGRSTFMVEMSEVAAIIQNATPKSLLILDEIGRGTSTYDGLSIAWAVLEYCAAKLRAKTLFATHYHELTQLEDILEGVVNYNIAVKKRGDSIIFLRKIVRGGTDDSYGIEVAKLAGVPDTVITRAKKILADIESGGEGVKIQKGQIKDKPDNGQIGFANLAANEIVDELKRLDANTLSPIESLNLLFGLIKKAKELS